MERWSEARAAAWSETRRWLAGFNYVPSTACNTTEWWQGGTVTDGVVNRELGWGAALGHNSVRVFLQQLVWEHDRAGFLARFERFLQLADGHGLSVMPVLFDDCAFGEPAQPDPYLGPQREPIPGMILPSWTPSPGHTKVVAEAAFPALGQYLLDVVGAFRADRRIVLWDLYNEPGNGAVGAPMGAASLPLVAAAFGWAREAMPEQPVSVGLWDFGRPELEPLNALCLASSDIVTFHCYADQAGLAARIESLRGHGRPLVCTEWMSRALGSRFETDLPLLRDSRVGAYMWGLVNGRTQAQFPWWNKPGDGIDPDHGWFHDVLYADGTPYREDEVAAIRRALLPRDAAAT